MSERSERMATGDETARRIDALRRAGLVGAADPGPQYTRWVANTVARAVPPATVVSIADEHRITPLSFAALDGCRELRDPAGRSYFVLPPRCTGGLARRAVAMTYVFNAGTGYAGDLPAEPYGAAELARIVARQAANRRSYALDVPFAHRCGARLATTPNAMLLGVGGNRLLRMFRRHGGTTWGDIFLLNESPAEPVDRLAEIVASGGAARARGQRDLARLLHHEEIHARQWARDGATGFIWRYVRDPQRFEAEAGLADGGYS